MKLGAVQTLVGLGNCDIAALDLFWRGLRE